MFSVWKSKLSSDCRFSNLIYVCIYIEDLFSNKRQSKNRNCKWQWQCQVWRSWFGKELFSNMHIHVKSSCPKCCKHHSKKWVSNANTKFDYHLLEKNFLHMNKCQYTHIYICMKSSFPKHDFRTCHCYCSLDFWIGVWRVLEKSSSCTHSYLKIYFQKHNLWTGH